MKNYYIETNTVELKNDVLNKLNLKRDTKQEQDLEEIILKIIEKREPNKIVDKETSIIMNDYNNFAVSRNTAKEIILNCLYEFEEINTRDIAENLISIFNFQFSNALCLLDFEDLELKYINLMQNETLQTESLLLYKINSNTDFTDICCCCDDCMNHSTNIIDYDMFQECCIDTLTEELYQDFNNEFNLRAWTQQIYEEN